MGDQGQDQRQTCWINGKLCINGIRPDFESDPLIQRPRPCNKWVRLIGRNPQTGQDIDEWCCNEWAKVKIGLENCQMVRHATASTDKVANHVSGLRGEVNASNQILLEAREAANLRLLDADPRNGIKTGSTGEPLCGEPSPEQ